MFLSTSFKETPSHNDLFLEQAKGYVKALEKSNFSDLELERGL
jgi:hypothetical protein